MKPIITICLVFVLSLCLISCKSPNEPQNVLKAQEISTAYVNTSYPEAWYQQYRYGWGMQSGGGYLQPSIWGENNCSEQYYPFNSTVIAAVEGPNDKGYIFMASGYYIRYDLKTGKLDCGYPLKVGVGNWAGMEPYATKIAGATLHVNGKIYFFLVDGTYIRYTWGSGVDAGYPKVLGVDGWPGMQNYRYMILDCLQMPKTDYTYFFLSNGTYVRYDSKTSKVDAGYPKPTAENWPGISAVNATKILACLNEGYHIYSTKKYGDYARFIFYGL